MEKRIIARGLLAGAIASVAAFVFARTFVEPLIDRAIAYEEAQAAGHEHGVEMFTRGVQANIGMGFGVLAFGVAMGALFAVVYCVAYGRVGNLSPRLLSVLLAGGMFLSLYVVPVPEVPAESAGGQPRRDDPAAHAAVPADGGAVGGAARRRGVAGPQSRWSGSARGARRSSRPRPTSWRSRS